MSAPSDVPDALDDIEDEIAELATKCERCRRIDLLAKAGSALGLLLLVLYAAGIPYRAPLGFLLGTTMLLGGIVAWGSNRTTWGLLVERITKLERRRRELIDALALRTVLH